MFAALKRTPGISGGCKLNTHQIKITLHNYITLYYFCDHMQPILHKLSCMLYWCELFFILCYYVFSWAGLPHV